MINIYFSFFIDTMIIFLYLTSFLISILVIPIAPLCILINVLSYLYIMPFKQFINSIIKSPLGQLVCILSSPPKPHAFVGLPLISAISGTSLTVGVSVTLLRIIPMIVFMCSMYWMGVLPDEGGAGNVENNAFVGTLMNHEGIILPNGIRIYHAIPHVRNAADLPVNPAEIMQYADSFPYLSRLLYLHDTFSFIAYGYQYVGTFSNNSPLPGTSFNPYNVDFFCRELIQQYPQHTDIIISIMERVNTYVAIRSTNGQGGDFALQCEDALQHVLRQSEILINRITPYSFSFEFPSLEYENDEEIVRQCCYLMYNFIMTGR